MSYSENIGILPAAGLATRMRGLPKFLLPVSYEVETLIEYHINLMQDFVDKILLPTSPANYGLVSQFASGKKVEISIQETSTMTATVLRSISSLQFGSCLLGMPDTYFNGGGNPYEILSQPKSELTLAVWRTDPQQQGKVGGIDLNSSGQVVASFDKDPGRIAKWHWGAMSFTKKILLEQASDDMPHVGYVINPSIASGVHVTAAVMQGEYYDCGIFSEYKRCIENI